MAELDAIKTIDEIQKLTENTQRLDVAKLFDLDDANRTDAYWMKLIRCLIKLTEIPKFKSDDREYDRDDFIDVPEKSVSSFELILVVMDKYKQYSSTNNVYQNRTNLNQILPELLVFCAVHSDMRFLWTNESAVELSQKLESTLCEIQRVDSIENLLMKSIEGSDTVYGLINTLLKPSLTKLNWKKNPSVKHVFYHYLLKVRQLSEYLDFLLPVSLMMIDDYRSENKVLGINSLSHIVKNSSKAELGWYGRVDVIYDALRHQMYTHEPLVVNALHPCLLDVLAVVEPSPKEPKNQARKWCRYDDVFEQFMQDMRFENKIILRRMYSEYLGLYIERMGITVTKHTTHLTQVITDYLEQFDGYEEIARFNILSCLKSYIRHCWPVLDCRQTATIAKSLLQFVFDLSVDSSLTSSETKRDLASRAAECLSSLDRASCGKVRELFTELKTVTDMNEMCKTFINSVFTTNSKQNGRSEKKAIDI
ncbi:TELO2-interacting protein 2-like [Tubulanus polymorphus]|uniref:TELO2-interacting protein 2-like n=1 Tax=Tubulanus polymorphus TaxID=672921 RepID=UPI003DA3DABF